MKFDSKALALSFGVISGAISAICALLLFVAPNLAYMLANFITHGADLAKIAKPITVDGAIIGTILIAALSYATAYVFSEIYNRSAKE